MPLFRRALLTAPPALLLTFPLSPLDAAASTSAPEPTDQIEVRILLETSYPDAQLKISDPRSGANVTMSLTDTSANRMAFSGILKKNGCITDYDCVVKWTEKLTDTFRLWVIWTRDAEISLALSPYDPPASRKAVDQLERLVPRHGRDDAMLTYVGGRRIFWKLWESSANRYSNLAITALRVWLSGALAASDLEPSFGRDESLVQTIERYRTKAAEDSKFSHRWQRVFENSEGLIKHFELYRTLEFKLYNDIPRLIERDNIKAATLIVEELLKRIDGSQRPAAIDHRGVDPARLLDYREQLRTRL